MPCWLSDPPTLPLITVLDWPPPAGRAPRIRPDVPCATCPAAAAARASGCATTYPVLVVWLARHTFPLCVLPILRQQTRPTLLVTVHTRAAGLLASHCPHLRIICAPERAIDDFCAMLRLLPHLHGGPLVLPPRLTRHRLRGVG